MQSSLDTQPSDESAQTTFGQWIFHELRSTAWGGLLPAFKSCCLGSVATLSLQGCLPFFGGNLFLLRGTLIVDDANLRGSDHGLDLQRVVDSNGCTQIEGPH